MFFFDLDRRSKAVGNYGFALKGSEDTLTLEQNDLTLFYGSSSL